MPHCPWTYRAISVTGDTILPCCRFQKDIKFESGDLMEEYKHGELASFRRRLDDGEKIKECHECWLDEEFGQKSMRQDGLERWGESKEINLKYAEFELDNICNLRCLTCNSHYSSAWIKDEIKMFDQTVLERDRKYNNIHEQIDLTNLETVKLFGGEPLLSKNILKLCQKLSTLDNLNNMEVIMSTNATKIPKEDIDKVFIGCRHLSINLSIDALGDLNHFLRYPTPWGRLLKNLKYFDELFDRRKNGTTYIGIHTVAYIYNINFISEIQDFFRVNFPRFTLRIDPLIRPKYLSIINLPVEYKSVIRKYLEEKSYDFLLPYIDREEENLFDYFIDNHKKIIELRKVDFSQLNPLLHEFIENYPKKKISQKKLFYFKTGGS